MKTGIRSIIISAAIAILWSFPVFSYIATPSQWDLDDNVILFKSLQPEFKINESVNSDIIESSDYEFVKTRSNNFAYTEVNGVRFYHIAYQNGYQYNSTDANTPINYTYDYIYDNGVFIPQYNIYVLSFYPGDDGTWEFDPFNHLGENEDQKLDINTNISAPYNANNSSKSTINAEIGFPGTTQHLGFRVNLVEGTNPNYYDGYCYVVDERGYIGYCFRRVNSPEYNIFLYSTYSFPDLITWDPDPEPDPDPVPVATPTEIPYPDANNGSGSGSSGSSTPLDLTVVIDAVNVVGGWCKSACNILEMLLDNICWSRKMDGFNQQFSFTSNFTGDTLTYSGMNIYKNSFSVDIASQKVIATQTPVTVNFAMMLSMKFDQIINYLGALSELWSSWFYPLRNLTPLYWRTYNSDTDKMEDANIAKVLYDITWYLGHIFKQGEEAVNTSQLNQDVQSMQQSLDQYEQAEQSVIGSVSSSLQSFNPNLSDIQSLRALGWCSNYLQLVWAALGTYGTMIVVGLLIGVCMQFLGYFKYK